MENEREYRYRMTAYTLGAVMLLAGMVPFGAFLAHKHGWDPVEAAGATLVPTGILVLAASFWINVEKARSALTMAALANAASATACLWVVCRSLMEARPSALDVAVTSYVFLLNAAVAAMAYGVARSLRGVYQSSASILSDRR